MLINALKRSYGRAHTFRVLFVAFSAGSGGASFIEFFHNFTTHFRFIGQVIDEFSERQIVLNRTVNRFIRKIIIGIGQGCLFGPIPNVKLLGIRMIIKHVIRQAMQIHFGSGINFSKAFLDATVQAPIGTDRSLGRFKFQFIPFRNEFIQMLVS